MLIHCPACGPRSHHEFTYGGDATIVRPAPDDTDIAKWQAFVYDRENPRGLHQELWHHVFGCRHWLKVTRNVTTHDISAVELLGPHAKDANAGEAGG